MIGLAPTTPRETTRDPRERADGPPPLARTAGLSGTIPPDAPAVGRPGFGSSGEFALAIPAGQAAPGPDVSHRLGGSPGRRVRRAVPAGSVAPVPVTGRVGVEPGGAAGAQPAAGAGGAADPARLGLPPP